MKNKLTETKFKPVGGVAGHLISAIVFLVAVILTCSSAWAENLFVADDNSIVELTPGGVRNTFASGLNSPQNLAFDDAGNVFVANGDSIIKFTPYGVRSIFAFGLANVGSLAFDGTGNLFAGGGGDFENNTAKIYKF